MQYSCEVVVARWDDNCIGYLYVAAYVGVVVAVGPQIATEGDG